MDVPNTHVRGERYVRLTFKPAGGKRRTVWAIKRAEKDTKLGRIAFYTRVDRYGNTTDPVEIILVKPSEVTERPAAIAKKYAWLEVLS